MRGIEEKTIIAVDLPIDHEDEYNKLTNRLKQTCPVLRVPKNWPHISLVYVGMLADYDLNKVIEVAASYQEVVKGEIIDVGGAGEFHIRQKWGDKINFHLRVRNEVLGSVRDEIRRGLKKQGIHLAYNQPNPSYHLSAGIVEDSDILPIKDSQVRSIRGMLNRADFSFTAEGLVIYKGGEKIRLRDHLVKSSSSNIQQGYAVGLNAVAF